MNPSTPATTTVIDPVCGMTIDPATSAGQSTYDGKTEYFCSRACKTEFDAARSAAGAPAARACGCSVAC